MPEKRPRLEMFYGYTIDRIRFKQLAKKKGLSMGDAAGILNYSCGAFAQKLSGKKSMMFDISQVRLLAEILDAEPEEIVTQDCRPEVMICDMCESDRDAVMYFAIKLRQNRREKGGKA